MSVLEIQLEDETYTAELLEGKAPESIQAMKEFLPHDSQLMHVRWSGHAVWVNIDEVELPEIPRENHTVYPSRGDVLLYPGYRNDQEVLLACGPTCFKSPAGELAGNHVAKINADEEELVTLEEATLRDGQMDITMRIRD